MSSDHPFEVEFDESLSNYAKAAAAFRAVRTHPALTSAALLKTAAATAALAVVPAAEASLIYSGPQNISITATAGMSSGTYMPIDLNGDGNNDLALLASIATRGSVDILMRLLVSRHQ